MFNSPLTYNYNLRPLSSTLDSPTHSPVTLRNADTRIQRLSQAIWTGLHKLYEHRYGITLALAGVGVLLVGTEALLCALPIFGCLLMLDIEKMRIQSSLERTRQESTLMIEKLQTLQAHFEGSDLNPQVSLVQQIEDSGSDQEIQESLAPTWTKLDNFYAELEALNGRSYSTFVSTLRTEQQDLQRITSGTSYAALPLKTEIVRRIRSMQELIESTIQAYQQIHNRCRTPA